MTVEVANNIEIPYLDSSNGAVRLVVDGKPFIVLGGELHNSSSSSLAYMEPVWGRLQELNCNTVIASVSWELVEPVEGQFDFSLVDGLLEGARTHDLRMILIWFGTWKNGISTYVPGWVKTDQQRFPRMKLRSGKTTDTLGFSEEACKADAAAFVAFMRHLREADEGVHTVITVQVENEVGLLGSPRDYSEEAEKLFHRELPAELTGYLEFRREQLLPEVRIPWEDNGRKKSASWGETFGPIAEEAFMAWHMARFVDRVAEAGKRELALPMFANAWTVQYEGELPGQYPSGGPVSRMMDIWRCAAPAIDFLAPDIYLPDFPAECASYARSGNPLFIPEARRDKWAAANVFYAIGKHDALCFAPFGIDSVGTNSVTAFANQVQEGIELMDSSYVGGMLSQCYKLLGGMMPILTKYFGTGKMTGVMQYGADIQTFDAGTYLLRIKFNKSSALNEGFPGAGIIIAVSESEFIVAGHGFSVEFQTKPGHPPYVGYLSIDEGEFENGAWKAGRRLNGDEHAVRLDKEPAVLRVAVYSYS